MGMEDDNFITLGTITETPPSADTGKSGINGRLQRIVQRLTTLIGQGSTTSEAISIEVTPTLTVHATYVSGDYVGTSGVAMAFTSALLVSGQRYFVQSAMLIDRALASIAGELWLFDTIPTPPADSAAWTISDAHAARCVGVIPFSAYYASAANSVAQQATNPVSFKALGTTLYGCYITRGAPALASGDLTFRLEIYPA
jgi:hypothetical protein